MGLTRESRSDGGLAIFVAQQALYRRVIQADYMSHRALFGILHDLLKARSAPFSLLDLACGDAGCSVAALRGTNVSEYIAVDLSEPALSVASDNAHSLGCATQVIRQDFQEYVNATSRRWGIILLASRFITWIAKPKLPSHLKFAAHLAQAANGFSSNRCSMARRRAKNFLIAGGLPLNTTGKRSLPRKGEPFGSMFHSMTFLRI
jgi:hypothetical protein